MDVKWILIGSHEDTSGVKWMSSGCQVDVEWMLSGWGVDINIDTGLFCSCYMEQGRVKSDSLLFHITRPKQPRAK